MSNIHRSIRVAVLVSGGGSNLEAILQAKENGQLPNIDVVLVISSKAGVQALDRAVRRKIEAVVIDPKTFSTDDAFQAAILRRLQDSKVDLVCLAGYLRKLGVGIIRAFQGRILNIHPALLPKYGGAGMYGHFVHEAVLKAGEKESGCTVHVVDEEFDHGPILAQARVPVKAGDTAATIAARVLEQEHTLYPATLKAFCETLKGTL